MSSQPKLYEAPTWEAVQLNRPAMLWRIVGVIEQVFASMMLVASLPLLIVVCLLTIILSRQGPLVAHRRIGRNGQIVWVVKVRTMWGGSRRRESDFRLIEYLNSTVVPDCKCRFDPRITSHFAVFCRKYSIDELPQLWLVARGEMSIVGPRPMTEEELIKHYGSNMAPALQVKPGLTGLWQVRGRNRLNYRQRRRLDMFMLKKWSLKLYLAILIASVPNVLTGRDAW